MKKMLISTLWLVSLGLAMPTKTFSASTEEPVEESVDPKQVLEIGDKRDTKKIQYLKRLKARKEKHKNSPASNAQMALAKMGEKKEMDEIVAEAKSAEPDVQSEAIEKLRYVGNKPAVRELRSLLSSSAKNRRKEWKGADGKVQRGHVIFEAPRHQAVRALQGLFPDGPKQKEKFITDDDVTAWKEWLNKNREKYE